MEKKIKDTYEIFRSKHLLKTGEIHHKMYYIGQLIVGSIIYFLYKVLIKLI